MCFTLLPREVPTGAAFQYLKVLNEILLRCSRGWGLVLKREQKNSNNVWITFAPCTATRCSLCCKYFISTYSLVSTGVQPTVLYSTLEALELID
jgi:hypothetical protein